MSNISSKRVVLTSFIVDLIDIATNVFVAFITGSVVMAAESFQGVADLTAVGLLLVGLVRSKRPATPTHPLGHGRELYFWTLIASILMLVLTATLSFYLGLQRFLDPQPLENLPLALIVLGIAVLTNGYAFVLDVRRILQNQPLRRLFTQFKDSAFIETKATFVLDLMGTSAALLGLCALILYQLTNYQQFDGIGAMIVGITLAILSIILIREAKVLLVGRRASQSIEQEIKQIVLTFPKVRQVVRLNTLLSGDNKITVSIDLHLVNNLNTDQIEELTKNIKSKVKLLLPSVEDMQIELAN